jgi:regulator of sirC expression with transglutaminase-like and TPR domain
MLAIAPEEPLLWRDAAALNERLERYAAALQCYERLAALLPEGEAAREVRAAMAAVRARLQ